ncbi:MAG TPA: G1 family glutamic endopeptidase [Acidimicrobiales bacterium]|nr:G1 family glutamic endopeptidase [Acidimicrobiales bacterium]
MGSRRSIDLVPERGGGRASLRLAKIVAGACLAVVGIAPLPAVAAPQSSLPQSSLPQSNFVLLRNPKVRAVSDKVVPKVVSLTAVPAAVGPAGGVVFVSARTSAGQNCTLRGSAARLTLVYSKAARSCANGVFRARVLVGPNRSQTAVRVRFRLAVSKGDRVGAAQVQLQVGAERVKQAVPPPSSTTPAATTTVPGSGAGTALPPGGAPAPPTPTTGPTTTVPATTVPATTVPVAGPSSASPATSQNWSGYAVTGGPFTSAQGSFVVPQLSASTTCAEHTSEWVGIDGFSVSGSNQDLIQAGIDESAIDPSTGACDPGNIYIVPWWEILPAPETPISGMTVSAGDSVLAQISQLSPTSWNIVLTDQTTGQTFSTQQSYSGSASSAEWILEAPVDQSNCGGICQLAPYCVAQGGTCSGPVPFSAVEAAGTQSQWWDISMDQGSGVVSAPSAFTGTSFTVTYTPVSNGLFHPSLAESAFAVVRTASAAMTGAGAQTHAPAPAGHRALGIYQG